MAQKATFLPSRSLPGEASSCLSHRAHAAAANGLKMEKSILRFPVLPPPQNRSRFSVRSRFGQWRLCRRHVRTTTSGLSPGETLILPFWDGLLGGTSQPGCQSVRASPPASPVGAPVCAAAAGARRSALLGDTGGKSVVPPPSVIFFFLIFFLFLPGNHRFLACRPFTERACKGITQSMQNGHLHILRTESVLSFQL